MQTIWENEHFFIEKHDNILPWVKLFTKTKYKEMSDLPQELKQELYSHLEQIELALKQYYNPHKINLASFGNMLPHLHWHIIARFKDDPYFPKTTWEEPVREFNLTLPPFSGFEKVLKEVLE